MQLQRFPLIILALTITFGACCTPSSADMEQETLTSVEQNEAVLHRVIELIGERNLDDAFELYALDYIYHGPGGQELRGRAGIRGLWEAWLSGFPDLHSTIEDTVSEGDRVVMRWRIEGTHTGEFLGVAPSNAKVNVGVTGIFRIANGQLVECWDQYDALGMMQQIGAIPKPETASTEQ